ncbi:hypothetical protein DBZ36_20440 [Alginatibacterium sediminis]|uniref:HdeD family acid-resistance protein n=1 Tax=Alginatibacterium sediminis TaxID=2164068 RepID=A0A420E585_9ALTE|nr:DUF308 domain-containing protein [Alginatibacterium sediminis]RKF12746.1 hypothetical protein DBZ36_20440 [Alginatibacterium sediminis]
MKDLTTIFKTSATFQSAIGFAVIIMGCIAMYSPFISGVVFSELLAITIAASSIATAGFAFKADTMKQGLFQFFSGVVGLLAAVYFYRTPALSLSLLTLTAIVYFIVDGLFMCYSAYEQRKQRGAGWILLGAISSLVLAAFLVMDWPVSGLYAIGTFVGIKLIVGGWTLAMVGFAGYQFSDDMEKASA